MPAHPHRPNFFYHLHPPTIPKREGSFRYTFGLGGISVLLFLVLTVTGTGPAPGATAAPGAKPTKVPDKNWGATAVTLPGGLAACG